MAHNENKILIRTVPEMTQITSAEKDIKSFFSNCIPLTQYATRKTEQAKQRHRDLLKEPK